MGVVLGCWVVLHFLGGVWLVGVGVESNFRVMFWVLALTMDFGLKTLAKLIKHSSNRRENFIF